MRRTILILLLFALIGVARAATIDPRVAKFDTCGRFELWHVNGIMTDPDGAAQNLLRLKEVYGNAYAEHLIFYGLAYNKTRGFESDMMASARQILLQYVGATWDNWMQAVTFGIYSLVMPQTTADAIAKQVSLQWGFNKVNPYKDEDLNAILASINTVGRPGTRKVIVGHSQGTLYVNEVYDKLVASGYRASNLGIVSIAAVTNTVRTGNSYITSSNDTVVDAVRIGTKLINPLNNVLASNVSIPVSDALGHNLRSIYMNNSYVRDRFRSLVTAEFASLRSSGAVTVTYLSYPNEVTYASSYWHSQIGTGVPPYGVPENYRYWTVAPYYSSQHVIVEGGTATQAQATTLANGKACYALAIPGIKKAQLALPASPYWQWAWFTMGYPNNYGCWDMMSGHPSTDYRYGAWWLYGGDLAPQWKVKGPIDTYTGLPTTVGGQVYAVGGAVCKV
ncbi:MAG: hypothetical protein ACXWID_17415 [Pyrinomonadaceae bacterium]